LAESQSEIVMDGRDGRVFLYDRLRFVARLLEGEQMSLLCRAFGISRKAG
jgi:hypothetical protein